MLLENYGFHPLARSKDLEHRISLEVIPDTNEADLLMSVELQATDNVEEKFRRPEPDLQDIRERWQSARPAPLLA